jgi:hypothetical protein
MATNTHRGALRSLPVLLALLIAFFAAPAAVPAAERLTGSAASVASSIVAGSNTSTSVTTTTESIPTPATEPVLRSPVADTTRVLATQDTAGTASSRAPPSTDA